MVALGVYAGFVDAGAKQDVSLNNAIFWPVSLPYMITKDYLQHNK
jgi:hypothetical protein